MKPKEFTKYIHECNQIIRQHLANPIPHLDHFLKTNPSTNIIRNPFLILLLDASSQIDTICVNELVEDVDTFIRTAYEQSSEYPDLPQTRLNSTSQTAMAATQIGYWLSNYPHTKRPRV